MKQFNLEWIIDEQDENKLIKQFLKEQHISKTALTDIKFDGGAILLNGEHVNVRHVLHIGDHLKVIFPKEKPSVDMVPKEIPINIVYEDSFLMLINKQPFLPTIPSREHPTNSLANGVMSYYQKIGLESTSHIVNRLDRDTSGLLIVAKFRHIHHLLTEQQKKGLLKRSYEALTHGLVLEEMGTINAPIGRKSDSIIERMVRQDGQDAVTHFKVLKYDEENNFSHLLIQLETGRTHQIRVHLSYKGNPLLGDDLYGGSKKRINRQALHCSKVSFSHPITLESMNFAIDLPEDMKSLFYNKNESEQG
ncbi:RluA family pseudouridine synthase [Litchfieldia alkalitelluris]|uniref:RluA family pseudouridine synthase n=1 Tax=Litchfieldia alkalitelluris TaxID=304268 RepID=UPI001958D4DC|nr:RluA family pseudouridine synthase [Litchfieldia alkalitelluris]